MPRWIAVVATTAAVLFGATVPAGAGQPPRAAADLHVRDARGDGHPDIVGLAVLHRTGSAAFVRVRVRGVQVRFSNEIRLYVDPFGRRHRPSYAFSLGLDDSGDFTMRHTKGWRLGAEIGTCGEQIRLRAPSTHVRVVAFRLSAACFGDVGARFAVRAVRQGRGGNRLGAVDWAPGKRTLSRTFFFG